MRWAVSLPIPSCSGRDGCHYYLGWRERHRLRELMHRYRHPSSMYVRLGRLRNVRWLPGVTCLVWVLAVACSYRAMAEERIPAPEFTQTEADAWLNSEPLTLADLGGQVILLDIWTYGCGNCRRSIPWMKYLRVPSSKRFSISIWATTHRQILS